MIDIIQSIGIIILGFLLYRLNKNVKKYSNVVQEVHIDVKGYEQLKEFEKRFAKSVINTSKVGTWKK